MSGPGSPVSRAVTRALRRHLVGPEQAWTFSPPPRVDSAVVRMRPRPQGQLTAVSEAGLVLTANLSYESLYQDHEIGGSTLDAAVLSDAVAYFNTLKAICTAYPY